MSGSYFQPIKREFLNLSGGTVTGDTVFTQGLYANSLSGGTLYSGSTNLEDIFLTSGDVSGTTLTEGSNINLYQSGVNYTISITDSPSFNDVYFSGNAIGGNVYGISLSGDSLYSGSTNLYDIFLTTADGNDITRVQPGVNITTGGTPNNPIINLSNDINVNSISAATIYSGLTDLYDIFLTPNEVTASTISSGSNVFVQQNGSDYNVSLVPSPSFDNISFSGTISGNTIDADLIQSGSTDLYSIFSTSDTFTTGSTFNPASKIATFNRNDGLNYTLNLSALTTVDTYVTGFTLSSNTLTIKQNEGQPDLSATLPTITLSGVLSSITYNIYTSGVMSAATFSGGTYYGDGSNLSGISTIDTYVTGFTYTPNTITLKQNEGQVDKTITINSFSALTTTGLTVQGISSLNGDVNVDGNVLITKNVTILGTATTINTETLTVKDNIITINSNATGNTAPLPINSGIEVLRNSGTTAALTWEETNGYWTAGLTGSTARIILEGDGLDLLNSGHTHPISEITGLQNALNTKFDKSGGTITGAVYVNNVFSANTLYSGSTNLYDIFLTTADGNDITRVQPGTNITTGGTGNNPIINLVNSPSVSNLSFSGVATGLALSATTISASTIYSGSTNLSNIFVNSILAGSNVSIGGTSIVPVVNIVASPSFNNLTLSGAANFNTLVVNSTSQLNGTITSGSLSGTTDRMVQVSSGGTFSATKQIISAYIVSGGTVANILENESNWDLNGDFIGSGITGTYMGQKHYNYNYFFEAIEDNDWIRLIRG